MNRDTPSRRLNRSKLAARSVGTAKIRVAPRSLRTGGRG